MAVAARFYIESITRKPAGGDSPIRDVVLRPVVRGDEGKAWSKWTPSGRIELTSLNPAASEWFEDHLGKDIAITFDDPADNLSE